MERQFQSNRRSIRIPGYDYARAGAYFVTICSWQRKQIFGEVSGERMDVNKWGSIVTEEWNELRSRRSNIELDAFVVMPNHVHGILFLGVEGKIGVGRFSNPRPLALGTIIGGYKAGVSRRINRLSQEQCKLKIWQRNYFERVIRSDAELAKFRTYIADNPRRWAQDKENPKRD